MSPISSTYGDRLLWAINQRPMPAGKSALARFVEDMRARSFARQKDGGSTIPGATFQSIATYLPKDGKAAAIEPKSDFTNQAALVCGVNADWLARNIGFPTKALEDANGIAMASPATSGDWKVDMKRTRSERLMHSVLTAIGIPRPDDGAPHLWYSPETFAAHWVGPLGEMRLRLIHGGTYNFRDPLGMSDPRGPEGGGSWIDQFIERDIGVALRGPLDALGISAEKMERDALGDYIIAMVPALLQLAAERARQQAGEEAERLYFAQQQHRIRMIKVTPAMHRKQEAAKTKQSTKRNAPKKSPTKTKPSRRKP